MRVPPCRLFSFGPFTQAFEGAYGTFVVTDFYGGAGGDADKEVQQGKNVVFAARQASAKGIYLTLSMI